jgi:hypothetical protein
MQRLWRRFRWPLLALAAVLASGLGFVGFSEFFRAIGEPRSPWDVLYLTIQLFTLESGSVSGPIPWQLQVARLLAPGVAGFAAIGALTVLFREHFDGFRTRFFRNHTVICALGRKGFLLAKSLRHRGDQVVIIEEDAENDLIDPAREHGAVVFIGDAREPQILARAGVPRARHLVAVSGDDGINAEVAVSARAMVSSRKGTPLSCLAHIVDSHLCTLLRMQEIGRKRKDPLRLDFFNVFESGARALLGDFPVIGPGRKGGSPTGHIVVVGLGRFGENLILQAARQWHAESPESKRKLRVTVVDQAADSLAAALSARHPWVRNVCELAPVDVDFEASAFTDALFLFDAQGNLDVAAIYVCVDSDSKGISVALSLYRHVKDQRIPIVVRMVHGAGLASLFSKDRSGEEEFAGLQAFGLLDRMCSPSLLFAGDHEILARAMHDQYVRDQTAKGVDPSANKALVPWDQLSENHKESNRAQAAHIGVKLAAVGCDLGPLVDWDAESFTFSPDEMEKLAQMEHERFVEERGGAGWGPGPKNPDRKRSPHLTPWRKLDEDTTDLDRVFIRNLPGILATAGFQIVRVEGGVQTKVTS